MNSNARLYRDGNMWCATPHGFQNLAISLAGFGETQQTAVIDLQKHTRKTIAFDEFEVGGYCRRCREWVPEDVQRDGCRDSDCPCG